MSLFFISLTVSSDIEPKSREIMSTGLPLLSRIQRAWHIRVFTAIEFAATLWACKLSGFLAVGQNPHIFTKSQLLCWVGLISHAWNQVL